MSTKNLRESRKLKRTNFDEISESDKTSSGSRFMQALRGNEVKEYKTEADSIKNTIIFSLLLGIILIAIGGEIIKGIGFFILFYGVFKSIMELFQNEEYLGDRIRTYHCPYCNNKLRMKDMPSEKGILFDCPLCKKHIRC